jgi:hypothetical protein
MPAPLANNSSVGGWIFAIADIATIFLAFGWVTILSLQATSRFLTRRGHGAVVSTLVLALLGVACFFGLWLPLGLVLLVRWMLTPALRRRP